MFSIFHYKSIKLLKKFEEINYYYYYYYYTTMRFHNQLLGNQATHVFSPGRDIFASRVNE